MPTRTTKKILPANAAPQPRWTVTKSLSAPGAAVKYRFIGKRVLLSACQPNGGTVPGVIPTSLVLSVDQFREIAKAVEGAEKARNDAEMRARVDRQIVLNNIDHLR